MLRAFVSFLTFLVSAGGAAAALHDRGHGLIYDDVRNITWLADVNYAKSSGFDGDGQMTWVTAHDWATSVVYAGVSGWRLPSAFNIDGTGPCIGEHFACSGSELGFMYFANLEVAYGDGIKTSTSPSLALIRNMPEMPDRSSGPDSLDAVWYWMAPPLSQFGDSAATFNVAFGWVDLFPIESFPIGYAWLVHDGDVVVVPEPSTYVLMLAGLGLVGYAIRRSKCA